MNPILDRESNDDKLSVLDILATDEHGRLLNIEMQTSLAAGFWQRLAYYVSTVYVGQLREGNDYADLRPAISICVLSDGVFPKSTGLHLDFRLKEANSGLILTDDIQIHLLQLKKLRATNKTVYNATPVERWAFFLQNAENLSLGDVCKIFPDDEFTEAAEVLEMISQTPEQMMLYNARLKFQRDEAARLRMALEGGREEGFRDGEAKGRQEGRQEGRITLLQELLGLPLTTPQEFMQYDLSQLNAFEERLQQQLRLRG